MLKSISSHFGYAFPPPLGAKAERTQSEGRTKATVCYNYTEKNKNQGATFEKKKWHYVAFDDNNNNNNNRYETTVHTLFHTPFHELQCKHSDQQTHTTKC